MLLECMCHSEMLLANQLVKELVRLREDCEFFDVDGPDSDTKGHIVQLKCTWPSLLVWRVIAYRRLNSGD